MYVYRHSQVEVCFVLFHSFSRASFVQCSPFPVVQIVEAQSRVLNSLFQEVVPYTQIRVLLCVLCPVPCKMLVKYIILFCLFLLIPFKLHPSFCCSHVEVLTRMEAFLKYRGSDTEAQVDLPCTTPMQQHVEYGTFRRKMQNQFSQRVIGFTGSSADNFQSTLHDKCIYQRVEDACELFMHICQSAISTSRKSFFALILRGSSPIFASFSNSAYDHENGGLDAHQREKIWKKIQKY